MNRTHRFIFIVTVTSSNLLSCSPCCLDTSIALSPLKKQQFESFVKTCRIWLDSVFLKKENNIINKVKLQVFVRGVNARPDMCLKSTKGKYFHSSPSSSYFSTGFVSGTMAQSSTGFSVYVAFYFVIIAFPSFLFASPGSSASNVLPLLQPYDFLYYSGVRAYFNGEWGKAAELLEKSILAKESLFRVRRKCHDDCVSAGKEALDKLGKFDIKSNSCCVWEGGEKGDC